MYATLVKRISRNLIGTMSSAAQPVSRCTIVLMSAKLLIDQIHIIYNFFFFFFFSFLSFFSFFFFFF
jgi:hypothetical protein